MAQLHGPFVGREAIAAGLLGKHQLRVGYRAVHPGVYVSASAQLTVADRAKAAWLWSGRRGVVMGSTAAALHGARWVDQARPVELVSANARPPSGVQTRKLSLRPDELMALRGLPVTTPARTAFDIGRRKPTGPTVAAMDALLRATGIRPEEVSMIAARHPGARGLRQVESVLDLVDSGAQSPRETWLRLLLIGDGLPRPTTQIPVPVDDRTTYYLDLGWEQVMIAVEYDGEQHRTDRWQYTKDIRRSEELANLGWLIIRVVAGDRSADILRRIHQAWRKRGIESALGASSLRPERVSS